MDEKEVIDQVSAFLARYRTGLMRGSAVYGDNVFYLTNCYTAIACRETGLVDEGNYRELEMCVEFWQRNYLEREKKPPAGWYGAAIDDEKVCLWEWAAIKQPPKLILHRRLIDTHHGDINTNLNWLFDTIIRHRYMMGV